MSKLEKVLISCIIIGLIAFGNAVLNPNLYQEIIPNPVQVEGVIKSKLKYTDYPSRVAQYDVAIAWGNLNEKEIDKHIRYSQSGRWYYYNFDRDVSVSLSYIAEHSANVHVISKDQLVLKKIENLNKNDHIKLKGYLVNVKFDNGIWSSSLTRTDTGNGACEIMYVTDVEVIE